MQRVKVKGVANPMDFPDDMDIEDIKSFLQKRFAGMAARGESTVNVDPRQAYAQEYKPPLQERFSTGIGDALTYTGLVDDNFRAQNIGDNIANIAAFTPIGSAFGGDEFGKALAEDDKLGMALGGLEALGVGGDIAKLAIFGGALAKSADLVALAKAKKLEAGGANRDEIWKETGWANDKGDWKFEIDDQKSEMMGIDYNEAITNAAVRGDSIEEIQALGKEAADYTYPFRRKGSRKLDDALGHSDLYEAYPDARYIRQQSTPQHALGEASYAPDLDLISNSEMNAKAAKSPILHELQHAIQQREGFATGGNLETANDIRNRVGGNVYTVAAKVQGLLDSGMSYSKISNLFKKTNDFPVLNRLIYETDILDQGLSQEQLRKKAGFYNYERLAGEAEARNVQTRMDWTPEQRRETPPWKSLDVPEEDLIYRKGGGLNQASVLGGDVLPGNKVGSLRPAGKPFMDESGNAKFIEADDGKFFKLHKRSGDWVDITGTVGEANAKASMKKASTPAPKAVRAQTVDEVDTIAGDTDYRIDHTAPTRDGMNTLDDMADAYPDDIYNSSVAGRYYGHGGESKSMDAETARIISGFKGKPNKDVTIYRAVPKGVTDINKGDWITINKNYANSHGDSWVDDGNYDVISKKVKAKDIATDGNSIHEFGYDPIKKPLID